MFRPAMLFIGLRYTRAKRRNHFISFISLMSMLGIALGVLVLITVLSVMNGFDREIQKRVFSMAPPITIGTVVNRVANWQDVAMVAQKMPGVTGVAPFISGQTLLTNDGFVQPAVVNGVEPQAEKTLSLLADKMVQGELASLMPGKFNVILGEDLANRLDAAIGSKITIVTTQFSLSPAGVLPRSKRFTVTGIFRAGGGFGFDASLAFINLTDGQKLFQLGAAVTGVHVNVQDVYAAPRIAAQLGKTLGSHAKMTDWTQTFGPFFHAVKLEKTMMFLILLLIIAVAVFNLVCSLVMVVNEKTSDIAILRTYGATPKMIMGIFIVQGAVIGVIGTLLGIIGGIALALNVTALVSWIERIFHVQFLSASVYLVDYLPSELQWMDVVQIGSAALILSLLATLYPAWRASRTTPVEALRYE